MRLYFGVRWPGSALARLRSHAAADRVASLAMSALAWQRFGPSPVTRCRVSRSFVGNRDVPQAKAAPGRRTPKSCA